MRSKDPTKDQRPAHPSGRDLEHRALPEAAASRFMEVKELAGAFTKQCVQGVDGQLAALCLVRDVLSEGTSDRKVFREDARDSALLLDAVARLQHHTASHLAEAVKGEPETAEFHRSEGARVATSLGIRPREMRLALADVTPKRSLHLRPDNTAPPLGAPLGPLQLLSRLESPSPDGLIEGIEGVRKVHRRFLDSVSADDQLGARAWATAASALESVLVSAARAYTSSLGPRHEVSLNDQTLILDIGARYDEARSAVVRINDSFDMKDRSAVRPHLEIAPSREETPHEDPGAASGADVLTTLVVPPVSPSISSLSGPLIDDMATALGVNPDELAATITVREHAGHRADELRAIHLEEVLDTLPSKERTVIQLRFFEDIDPAEVSKRLGTTLEWIHVIEERALARLRRAETPSKRPRNSV